MEKRYSDPTSSDADFQSLLADSDFPPPSSDTSIPNVAHFIYTSGKEVGWIEWLAIRGALVNLDVEKVVLWLPTGEQMQGAMWKRLEAMEGVQIQKIKMPEKVYGHDIPDKYRSHVARLKILWEQGGIFLENDLVAIKSIDDILRGDNATSTVMARRLSPEGVPNWLIMSKPGSPFLKQWMQAYEGEWDLSWDESTWKDDSWEKMAVETPTKLADIGGQGLVILDGHSWFYPLAAESNGDVALKKLWFGKSWNSIDESYGTHVWHWDEGVRELVTPRNIRMIDTPLFCQLRPLFDDLDSDGYIATAVRKNANCSSVRAASLKRRNHRMFSDYRMAGDEHDIKWVDSSGYHLHGWAPKGTPLRNDAAGGTHRMMGEHSFAVLPVPSGWDTRTWTARMDVKLDPGTLDGDKLVGLFKIRTERDGDILTRVGNQRGSGYIMDIEWRDLSRSKAKEVLSHWKTQTRGYIKSPDLRQVQQSWHHVAITFDRREKGEMGLYIDGVQMGTQPLSLQKKPNLGQEIWINAREWDEIDMGFRGSLGRFTMYADALTAETVNGTIPANAASLLNLPVVDLQHVPVTKPQGSLFFILMVIMVLSLVLVRMKKGLVRDGLWHVREGIRHLRIWFLNR